MRTADAILGIFVVVALTGEFGHAFAKRREAVKPIHVAQAIIEKDTKKLQTLLQQNPYLANKLADCGEQDGCGSDESLHDDDERVCNAFCASRQSPEERCEGCYTLPVLPPLSIALRMNNIAALKTLIKLGAVIDKSLLDDMNDRGKSQLYPALIEARTPNAAMVLLDAKASANFCTRYEIIESDYTSRYETIVRHSPAWGGCPDSPNVRFCTLPYEEYCYRPRPVREILEGRVKKDAGWRAVVDRI